MNKNETKDMLRLKEERIKYWEEHKIVPSIPTLKELIEMRGMVRV